jgi:subtilisin family serine protease
VLVPRRLVRLLALVACLVAGVAVPASAGEPAQRPPAAAATPGDASARPPDLVTLDLSGNRSTAARDALARVVERLGGQVRGGSQREVDVLVPADRTDAAVRALAARLGASRVAVSAVLSPALLPDDRLISRQGHLAEVRLPQAWQRSRGSSAVTVAVLDTGVDRTHPDLRRAIAGAYNAVSGTTSVTDEIGHGTAVAGVAAAETDNGRGIAGAGFDTSLLAVKVATPGKAGVIYGADLARGIRWATDQGADVINMSLGGPNADVAMRDAVAYAAAKGVVLVAAAGNDGDTVRSYPAALEGVIAVGATDGPRRALFSSYGGWVDVAAPGRGIYTTLAGGGYARWDGTSFAAPIVAGQAALLLARRPGATPARVESVIERSATAAGATAFAHGQVDVRGSLDWLLGAPPTPPRSTAAAPGAGSALVSWRAPLTTYGAAVTRYRVEVRGPSGTWRGAGSAPGTSRALSVVPLRNGVAYDVRVRAESVFGLGRPGEVVRVRVGVPSAPRDLVATSSGARIGAGWERPAHPAAGVDAYLVEWRRVGETRWASERVPTREWGSPSLTTGRYEVRVRALNEYGTSAASVARRVLVGG